MDDSKDPNAEILITINTEEFIQRVMERYLKQNLGQNR